MSLRQEYGRERGIPLAYLKSMGVKNVPRSAKRPPGIRYPVRGPDQKPKFYRTRYIPAHSYIKDGKRVEQRFDIPKDHQHEALNFLPLTRGRSWDGILADPKIPIYFAESEFKAAALALMGYAAVTAGSVQGHRDKSSGGAPCLDCINWGKRAVYIVFDNDIHINWRVQDGFFNLSQHLINRGATVEAILLPPPEYDPDTNEPIKIGFDDWRLQQGNKAKANFETLLRKSPTDPMFAKWGKYEKPPSPAPEVFVLKQHIEPVSKMVKRDIDPVTYLFDGMMAVGACSILAGPPKGFKSTLALWLSLVLVGAIKSDWTKFARVDGGPLRVGYLDLEQADPLFMERLKQFNPKEKALKRLFRINAFPKFDADGISELERLIVKKRLDVCFVDTIARVRAPERGRSASAQDAELLDPVTKIAHNTNCHVCVLAHNGKRKDFDNPADMIAATAALSGAVDDLMVIFKPDRADRELQRNLFLSGRHIRAPGVYVIDRTDSGFEFLGEASDVIEGEVQKNVLAALNGAKNPMTPTEIGKLIGRDRIAVQKVLPKLLERRIVFTEGSGRYENMDTAIKNRKSR